AVTTRLAASPRRQRAWRLAFMLARARLEARAAGRRLGPLRAGAWRVADRAVLSRVRRIFGGRLKFIVSGSAPMPMELLEWFEAIGIPILEAYGTSENIVPIAANALHDRRSGTVGRPLSANEVRVTSQGEILVRGAGVLIPALA